MTLLFLLGGCRSDANLIGGGDMADTASPPAAEDTGDDGGSETEDPFPAQPPADTPTYVFVVNTDRDTLSRVQVPGYAVLTVAVGEGPSSVVTTADHLRAVTFNAAGNSLSVVDAASMSSSEVEIRPGLNAVELSPDGRWALAWRDPEGEANPDAGVSSTNEISFVDTLSHAHFPLVAGFAPTDVSFTPDGQKALVIADAWLAVVELGTGTPTVTLLSITEDSLDPPKAEELLVSPDSKWAFIRHFGSTELVVVDLESLVVATVDAGENTTDLDLSPDGSEAVVVSRESEELRLFSLSDPFAAPTTVALPEGEEIGSLVFSPDGSRAALFTNASAVAHVTVWERGDGALRTWLLPKPVSSVSFSEDGARIIIFHTLEGNADTAPGYRGVEVVTLMDVESGLQNAVILPEAPLAWSQSDDGAYAFLIMEGQRRLGAFDMGALLFEDIALLSEPTHVGTLDGTHTAWVNQEHELGRLSFLDADSGHLETVTGFELNAAVER